MLGSNLNAATAKKEESLMDEKPSEVRMLANCIWIVAIMELEELLDALEFTEAVLSGKTVETDKKVSTNVQEYETELCELNNCSTDKYFVSIARQYLTTVIIEKNKKTADIEEGKRLYRELMDEE